MIAARLSPPVRALLDAIWLLALALFVLAGMTLATFHGDEAMQIYMSHDYATTFIYKDPLRLETSPPYDIDSDQQLRLLNGSVNRYGIGLGWHLAGLTDGDLPPAPGWDWGLDYDRNVQTGHRPSDQLLTAGRASSTLFLAVSAAIMFGLGWQFGGRPLAYFVSGLYAVNPVVLLNGRRAMMEGSLLCFGLLAILLAAVISRRREQGAGGLWGWWIALTLSGGLALASKHSALVFVAAAYGWIFVAEMTRRNVVGIVTTSVKLAVSLILAALLFVGLSPALWNDPLARLQDLVAARERLIDIQIAADPLAPTTILQRVEGILIQPFLAPPMHYEVAYWANAQAITDEINGYMTSPLSGLQFGLVLGVPLTLLAGLGLIACLWLRPRGSWALSVGTLVWFAAATASVLVNPLPWQRYYLPLYPVASLLAGIGGAAVFRLFVQKRRQKLVPESLPVAAS